MQRRKWENDVLPPDIEACNFASMEDGVRRTIAANDSWKADYMTEPLYELERLTAEVPELHAVHAWRPTEMPAVRPELVPFIKEYMKQDGAHNVLHHGCVFQGAIQRICQDGAATSMQQATDALIMWTERHPKMAGKVLGKHVGWGGRYPSSDYTAQELSIGNLQFLCVDMGFGLPIGVHLRTALGNQINANGIILFARIWRWARNGYRKAYLDAFPTRVGW